MWTESSRQESKAAADMRTKHHRQDSKAAPYQVASMMVLQAVSPKGKKSLIHQIVRA
jgi:hypothetical protein